VIAPHLNTYQTKCSL